MNFDFWGITGDLTPIFVKHSGRVLLIAAILIVYRMGKYVRWEWKDSRINEICKRTEKILIKTDEILDYMRKKDE